MTRKKVSVLAAPAVGGHGRAIVLAYKDGDEYKQLEEHVDNPRIWVRNDSSPVWDKDKIAQAIAVTVVHSDEGTFTKATAH
jgi:hypothetical protein